MKKIIITATLLISMVATAQKDELKGLKKIYSKDTPSAADVTEYKSLLNKLEPIASEEGDKVYFNFYKAILPEIEISSLGTAPNPMQLQKAFSSKAILEISTAFKATLDYEKKSGKKVLTDDINEDITAVKPIFGTVANALSKANKNADAATIFYAIYQLDNKITDNLYYAASYAVNGEDFENALRYYKELKAINYTGEATLFYAFNKANKADEYFTTKEQRDTYIKVGTHEKPHEEKIPSRKGEIYKNIALILASQGKNDEAKQAFADARKANPGLTSLVLAEADLYIKLKDYDTYTKLVNEILQADPNNAELLFNLGVISSTANKLDIAEDYYKKAIAIDPTYFNAYINLAELKMRGDQKYVDEINKLGTSDKELKRYEVLKNERNKNFMAVLPLLEKSVELKPEDEGAKRTLLSIYNALEMTDKAKALKTKM